jgi:hypothetical protein
MPTCSRYDILLWASYRKGQLDPVLLSQMKAHYETCGDCRVLCELLGKIGDAADLDSLAPPESWMWEAVAKFDSISKSSAATAFDPPKAESVLYGELVFDSYLQDAEVVRSRRTETRRLLFEFPDFDIDVALGYAGRCIEKLMGHILPKDIGSRFIVEGCVLELVSDDEMYAGNPNTLGEFVFDLAARRNAGSLVLRCKFQEGPCAVVLILC